MSAAFLSLAAFAIAILFSCFTPINVGLLSIAFAFFVGVFFAGMKASDVAAGFPSSLFLVLVGVSLLFAQAKVNGSLDPVVNRSVRLARGNPGIVPLVFFFLAMALSTIGAGNIAATAALAPLAMSVAGRIGVSAFLMTIMVATGANSGALSPFAPTGIIANGQLARIGITSVEWRIFSSNLIAQTFVGITGYFLLGGTRLLAREVTAGHAAPDAPFDWRQSLTLAAIATWILSVVVFGLDVGMSAFIAAAVLTLARAADEEQAIKAIPWNTILMVAGVTVLISVLEKTGGMDLFTGFLTRFSTPRSITGVIAFVTGVISVYSSSSGVVLPSFLPTIPGLIEKLGGGDALAIASSINVGAHLVDVSPLSTLGALCIAVAPAHENRTRLFNKLLLWGLSMSVVGAAVCYVFFGLLGI
ncbi:MAG TPA: SLC13 family permease [Vicinamibacteria bacterium]|nr:SLC13 family permease [Vicinamibacteria bacterium]